MKGLAEQVRPAPYVLHALDTAPAQCHADRAEAQGLNVAVDDDHGDTECLPQAFRRIPGVLGPKDRLALGYVGEVGPTVGHKDAPVVCEKSPRDPAKYPVGLGNDHLAECGGQAGAQGELLCLFRDLDRGQVHDPTLPHRHGLAGHDKNVAFRRSNARLLPGYFKPFWEVVSGIECPGRQGIDRDRAWCWHQGPHRPLG